MFTRPHNMELRIAPRIEVKMNVEFAVTYVYTTAQVINLSTGGVFIRTHSPLPEGTEVKLRMHFNEDPTPVETRGVVRWIRPDNEHSAVPGGMGVEFLDLPDEVKVQTTKHIQEGPKNF